MGPYVWWRQDQENIIPLPFLMATFLLLENVYCGMCDRVTGLPGQSEGLQDHSNIVMIHEDHGAGAD